MNWLIEQRLTSQQTNYRSYRGRFLQVIWPNQQCQSTEGNQLAKWNCFHDIFLTNSTLRIAYLMFEKSHAIMSWTTKQHNTLSHLKYWLFVNKLTEVGRLERGTRNFQPFLLLWPWPWPNDLHIQTWPIFPRDTPDVKNSYIKAFESYRLTDR